MPCTFAWICKISSRRTDHGQRPGWIALFRRWSRSPSVTLLGPCSPGFITPASAQERPGRWQHYYSRWPQVTRENLPPEQLELVPALARFAPPANIVDKEFYSAFAGSRLFALLAQKHVTTLIVTGTETDICVLSTVFNAIDLGFRVILVEDALCSSSDEGHDALMTMYRSRLTHQIELINSNDLSELWVE